MMNKFLVNPALAGVKGYTNISFTARQQYSYASEFPADFRPERRYTIAGGQLDPPEK